MFNILVILCRCQSIINDHDELDIKISLLLFQTLAATREWRRAWTVIDKYQVHCCAENVGEFSLLAANAFWENEPEIGWKTLENIIGQDFAPQCVAFSAYWNYCSANREDGFIEKVEKMLDFIGEHGVLVSEAVISELQGALDNPYVAQVSISGK